MALKKVKELPSGATGEYWKVVQVSADRLKSELSCKIALFKDKASSDAGKKHLGFVISCSSVFNKQQLSGDLTALAYQMVKGKCLQENPPVLDVMIKNNLSGSEDV